MPRSGADVAKEITLRFENFEAVMGGVSDIETALRAAGDAAESMRGDFSTAGEAAEQINAELDEASAAARKTADSADSMSSAFREAADRFSLADDLREARGQAENVSDILSRMRAEGAVNPIEIDEGQIRRARRAIERLQTEAANPLRAASGRFSPGGRLNTARAARRSAATRTSGIGAARSRGAARRAIERLQTEAANPLRAASGIDSAASPAARADRLASALQNAEVAMAGVESASETTGAEVEAVSQEARMLQNLLAEAEVHMEDISDPSEKLKTEMSQVSAEVRELADGAEMSEKEIVQLTQRTQRLKSRTAEVAHNTRDVGVFASEARQLSMGLGNVLADAAHGPAAMANNIGNVVEGFGHLETKGRSVKDLLSAIAGPALMGGLITAAVEIAANWDRIASNAEAFAEYLSGVDEEITALREFAEKQFEQSLGDLVSEMDVERAKELRNALQEAQKAAEQLRRREGARIRQGSAMGFVGTETRTAAAKKSGEPLTSDQQTLLTELEKRLRGDARTMQQAIDELRPLLKSGEISQAVYADALRSFSDVISEGGSGAAGTGGAGPPSAPFFGERTTPVSAQARAGAGALVPVGNIDFSGDLFAEQIEKRFATIDRRLRQALMRSEANMTGRRATILDETSAGSVARQQRMARLEMRTGVRRNMRRAQATRRKLAVDGLSAEREQRLNAKLDKILAKRRLIYAQYYDRKEKIEQQAAQKEKKRQRRQLQRFRKFSESFSRIGQSTTDLFRMWREQRVAELKKQGKSEAEIQEKIREEGKAHFRFMKALRIATSLANTFAAGITAYRQAQAATGPFGTAAAIAEMVAATTAGLVQVKKIANLKIGDSVPSAGGGAGGGSTNKFTALNNEIRGTRASNFAEEAERDRVQRPDEDAAAAIREEQAKTRDTMKKTNAVGDDEAFAAQEAAEKFESKAVS